MKRLHRRAIIRLAGATSITGFWPASAQQPGAWQPTERVTYVIGVAPGGTVDLYARGIRDQLEGQKLVNGQAVVPENKVGAGGAIALQALAQNAGNGHWLGTFHTGSIAGAVTGLIKADVRQFPPVAMMVEETSVVAVRADSPIRSGADLVAALNGTALGGGLDQPGATNPLFGWVQASGPVDTTGTTANTDSGDVAALMAGALEMGAERSMHRIVLETARSLDRVTTLDQVVKTTMATVLELAQPMLAEPTNPNAKLIDRALLYIERRFALPISDSEIADHLGLSASHFRFLFREATGQPFHKYLVSKRLERARQLLVEQGLPVSEVAAAVGFANASHFSRAFAQRFGTSPIQMRRAAS